MSETINFINKLNESALTSDEPISDETKRFVKGISKEDRDAGKSFSTDDFNEFKKRLKANGLSKFTDKEYSELFDYYFECYNDEAMKNLKESVNWDYFNRFEDIYQEYMPDIGEGETLASQTVTAVNKLIYKWYNDGDVFDNVHSNLRGWANDLSSFANWLYKYVPGKTQTILKNIYGMNETSDYEYLLKELADYCLNEDLLQSLKTDKQGSVYRCDGPFEFNEDEYKDGEYDDEEDWPDDEDNLEESKELKESVISDMKKKGLYDYIVNEYYNMDKDKLADIAKEAVYVLYNQDKDLIKTYKENLKKYTDIEDDIIEAADGHYMDYLSAHYSELSKSDLKDFAKEALALIMDNNLVDEYIEDLKNNTVWADEEDDLEESDNNRKIKIGSKVYWIGAGNEISSEGEVIDFPVDGRMTIKWDDNEQNTYDITHPNIILADNYDNSVNESENKIDPNNLTSDQLSKLRKDITLNSTFTDDYKNSLGIDSQLVQNFFDGYIEYLSEMIQEDIGEDKYDELDDNDWYNYINKYDTLENLEHYYNAVRVID